MGGAVSAGVDNDELIDNLMEAEYIKTSLIERVFRAVDRGHYFTEDCKENAYKDFAWKSGNLHISAPCIYSEVMENLELEPGLSFLNLGSGTGYLSTMVGLVLGRHGINHGVEYHEDVLNYANEKLKDFCENSPAVDEFEFCLPTFVHGNCLSLGSEMRQYDRVYCGAACPENYEQYMRNIIKVGGILVLPVNDRLLQIKRASETEWETKSVLPVSFATLIGSSNENTASSLKLPEFEPMSLQELCRFQVRRILRQNIDKDHPELKSRPVSGPRKKTRRRTLRQLVIPIFGGSSDNDDADTQEGDASHDRNIGQAGFYVDTTSCRAIIDLSEFFSRRREEQASTSAARTEENTETIEMAAGESIRDVELAVEGPIADVKITQSTTKQDESSDGYLSDENSMDAETEEKNVEKINENGVRETLNANRPKREKFDSGIVEDMDDSDEKVSSDSSSDEDIDMEDSDDDDDSDDELYNWVKAKAKLEEKKVTLAKPEPPAITHRTYMKDKISHLPLPNTLKAYLS